MRVKLVMTIFVTLEDTKLLSKSLLVAILFADARISNINLLLVPFVHLSQYFSRTMTSFFRSAPSFIVSLISLRTLVEF